MEVKTERSRPVAVFMAFGTKGDVYPIAAVAAAFACDQRNYEVFFITHSAHQDLASHLAENNVTYTPVSSPPVIPPENDEHDNNSLTMSFCNKKRAVTREHRQECLLIMERIFGDGPNMESDFVLINFFALEGWSLAELFHVQCVAAAPYVVPYTAPSSFERHFRQEHPLLYQYLQEAPDGKLGWKDVIHWMWPLFSEDWGSWRRDELNLSPLPFTDPVTGHPMWHERPLSPVLLYGFSKEVVECPGYWPSNSRVSGFWFLPSKWQFSCSNCQAMLPGLFIMPRVPVSDPRDSDKGVDTGSSILGQNQGIFFQNSRIGHSGPHPYPIPVPESMQHRLCSNHAELHNFLDANQSIPLVFISLSSAGSMGFMKNPRALLCILQTAIEITKCRFILLTAGYEPLDMAVLDIAAEMNSCFLSQSIDLSNGISLCNGYLYCFSGSIPYSWLFPKCAVAVHHGGSGSTAAALKAGIPQIICPFMLDQFYWAERMCWLGVAPEPLKRTHLLPVNCDDVSIREGADVLRNAVNRAMSPEIKARALEISEKISQENGVSEAVRILKEEFS